MKCVYCGFTYDDEPVCPICGTPAPSREEYMPQYDYDYNSYDPNTQAPPPVSDAYTRQAPPVMSEPAAYREPSKPRHAKKSPPGGLEIAAFCVLSVIAAALVYLSVIQTIGVFSTPDRERPPVTEHVRRAPSTEDQIIKSNR